MEECAICGSKKIIKYGIVKKKQRYKCRGCSKIFRPDPLPEKIFDKEIQSVQLFLEGFSIRWIKEFADKNVSYDTIDKWIKMVISNLKKYKKSSKSIKIDVENYTDLNHELSKITIQNESKLFSGVLLIGLDVTNPFSCTIRTIDRNQKKEKNKSIKPNAPQIISSDFKEKTSNSRKQSVRTDDLQDEDFYF